MDLFTAGVEKESEELTEEEELQFRDLQADLIRRTQFLKHRMPDGVFDVEDDVRKLFRQSISLRIIQSEPSIKINDLRTQWHEISIALNKMHGQLRSALEEEMSRGKKKKKRRR